MKFKLFLFLFFFAFAQFVSAQNAPDSLFSILNSQKEDTSKVRAYINIANYFIEEELDSAVKYINKAVQLAQKLNNPYMTGMAMNRKGVVFRERGDYDTALVYLKKAFTLADEIKKTDLKISVANNLGNTYSDYGDYELALKYHLISYNLAQKTGNKRSISYSLNNIGLIYHYLNDYDKALTFFQEALKLKTELHDIKGIINTLNSLSYTYISRMEYDKAIEFCNRALAIQDSAKISYNVQAIYTNIGLAYDMKGENEKALDYYFKSKKLIEEVGSKQAEAIVYNNIGTIYVEQNDYKKAFEYIMHSYNVATEIGSNEDILEASKNLADLCSKMNNYKQALYFLNTANAIRDTLNSRRRETAIAEMRVKFEMEKMEETNKLLAKENELAKMNITQKNFFLYGILILMALLVTSGYLFFRNNKIKETQKKSDLEQKALLLQMNPHFIFNAMNAIQGFYASGEHEKGKLYISKFSKLLRLILESSKEVTISLQHEIDILNNYLELAALRFEDKFTYEINIDPDLDCNQVAISPMLIQPYVENSLLHGIASLKTKGRIRINFSKKNQYLECSIEDNGVGRDKSKELNKNRIHKSTGMDVTAERIKLMNRLTSLNGNSIEIADLKDDSGSATGTKVTFKVKLQTIWN